MRRDLDLVLAQALERNVCARELRYRAHPQSDDADAAVLEAENTVRALEIEKVKMQETALSHSKVATRARTGEERAAEIAAMFAAEKREKELDGEIADAKKRRSSLVQRAERAALSHGIRVSGAYANASDQRTLQQCIPGAER